MEKILNSNERVRRAEEIYARRQNIRERTRRATVNVSEPKNFKLLKKVVLQIIISVLIYFIFYLVNTTNYSFSQEAIDKTHDLLSNDTDFAKIYNNISQTINEYITNLNLDNSVTNEINNIEQNLVEGKDEMQNEVPKENDQNGEDEIGVIDDIEENEQTGKESLEEVGMNETERIKNEYSFIMPVNRVDYIRIWNKREYIQYSIYIS